MIDDQLRGGFIRYINRTFTEFVLQPGRLKQVAGKGISMGNTVWKTTQIVDPRYIGAARADVGYRPAGGGILSLGWNGRDQADRMVASGVYFYRLATAGFSQTRKMILIK